MLIAGKSTAQVANFFGLSKATIHRYIPEGIPALRAAAGNSALPRPPRRRHVVRKPGTRLGRRKRLSENQIDALVAARQSHSVEQLAAIYNVSVYAVYRYLRERSHKRGAEANG
jgi:transposase